ncbi:hypothetical protein HHX47_DHR3000306 [Lentinula edodes]|nr:hypothetical protein HHX47_DHR3000306 [Lentinula edodes]
MQEYIFLFGDPDTVPERFVVHLGTHIVSKYAHIHQAFVDIERLRWSRIVVGKDRRPHRHSFFRDGDEKRTVKVKVDGTAGKDKIQARARAVVNDLMGLKSSGSSFTSFIRDEYTLLKEVDERIFSTSVDLNYRFAPIRISPPKDEKKLDIVIPAFDQAEAGSVWDATVLDRRTITLEVFAEDESASVQATLYKMGQRIIAENASVQSWGGKFDADAVDSLTDDGELAVILIGEGQYFETVNVTRSSPLTILGQLPASYAIVPISTPFANASQPNLVQIFNTVFVENGIDDAATAVLTVAPNGAAALIGAGTTGAPTQGAFGNVDFKMYNVDIQNRASLTFAISQALATDISYANASFYGCGFSSFQDTWYTGKNASTYVVDSVIFGQTDYLFGFGTAWFQNVILAARGCGGGTAAWKGTNSSLTERVLRYGAYIADSRVIRSPDANATLNITDGCYLGRPWNDWAVTVYLNTFMEDIIQPVGWEAFDSARPTIMNTTFYAEYNSTGPGGDTSSRLSIEHLLTAEQAQEFTVDGVFLEHPSWIDYGYLY